MRSNAGSQNIDELLDELEKTDELPSQPDVVVQIIDLLQDPDADFTKLLDILTQDPALSAKLLKVANSAMYSRRRKVTNLSQALLTLGQAAAATVALSFSLVGAIRDQPVGGISLSHYWRRSFVVAMAARNIGRHIGIEITEELFLAGLLQDVGMLVLDKLIPEDYMQLGDGLLDHERVCRCEVDRLSVDHAWVGAWLLNKWGLPELICQAVRHSHSSSTEPTNQPHQNFIDCSRTASLVADVLLTDQRDETILELAGATRGRFGMDAEETLALLEEINQQIPDVESQFEVAILDPAIAVTIVDRARSVLTEVSLNAQREIQQLRHQFDTLDARARTLEDERYTDKLTRVRNRDYLEKQLEERVLRARQFGFPVNIAFMDLDGFKAINDNHGHGIGDQILRSTARTLGGYVRDSDVFARFGGDEFVLLLGDESPEKARAVCDRLLASFNQSTHFVGDGRGGFHLTISIGLASLLVNEDVSAKDLIEAADMALLQAKRAGKARVSSVKDL